MTAPANWTPHGARNWIVPADAIIAASDAAILDIGSHATCDPYNDTSGDFEIEVDLTTILAGNYYSGGVVFCLNNNNIYENYAVFTHTDATGAWVTMRKNVEMADGWSGTIVGEQKWIAVLITNQRFTLKIKRVGNNFTIAINGSFSTYTWVDSTYTVGDIGVCFPNQITNLNSENRCHSITVNGVGPTPNTRRIFLIT